MGRYNNSKTRGIVVIIQHWFPLLCEQSWCSRESDIVEGESMALLLWTMPVGTFVAAWSSIPGQRSWRAWSIVVENKNRNNKVCCTNWSLLSQCLLISVTATSDSEWMTRILDVSSFYSTCVQPSACDWLQSNLPSNQCVFLAYSGPQDITFMVTWTRSWHHNMLLFLTYLFRPMGLSLLWEGRLSVFNGR